MTPTVARLTTRAAQLVLLGGLAPTLAVDTAAAAISSSPGAIRLAIRIVSAADRPQLRRMAAGRGPGAPGKLQRAG